MEIYALKVFFFVMAEHQKLFWILPTVLSQNILEVSVDWIRILTDKPENAN